MDVGGFLVWSESTPPTVDELLPGLAVLSLEETDLVFDDVTRFSVDVKDWLSVLVGSDGT